MSIQTQNLRMTTLEVLNHQPIKTDHPRLKDGIHLRWNPGKAVSFPWYGYYLLRRDHVEPKEFRCMHAGWIRPFSVQIPYMTASVGELRRNYMITQYGNWLSDKNIKLIDEFPPHQVTDNIRMVEVDLENRKFCHFFFNYTVNSVFFYIGFKENTAVTIHYKLFNKTIKTQIIDGGPDQILPAFFTTDAITSVTIEGAPAAVVAMCHIPVDQNLYEGWEFIDGIRYPICLPVNHPNYPCPNKPLSNLQSTDLAIDRVIYDDPNKWRDSPSPGDPSHVERLHELITKMVQAGPGGPAMTDVFNQFIEDGEPNPAAPEALSMPSQKPMDLVLLGALDPGVAQMTGLYALDSTAQPDKAYDYIIIGDHTGVFKAIYDQIGTEQGFHGYINTFKKHINLVDLDGWICYNRVLKQVNDLAAPTDLKVYALPGMTVRDESTGLIKNSDARNSAGLNWDLGLNIDDLLNPNKAVMYELWRHHYGDTEPSQIANDNQFAAVSKSPFVVVKLDAIVDSESETSPEFPPFRIHAYDNYLKDGWYSHKLIGRGLFGRYSDLSEAASWHQWAPAPDPLPHYYISPPSHQQLNSFASHLLDLTPPPPPSLTEAVALDHEDRFLQKDAAYDQWRANIENSTWFNALSPTEQKNMIGLRVRWQWTLYHMRKAPNVISFKLYYNPGYHPPANSAESSSWNNFLLEHDYDDPQSENIRVMNDIDGKKMEGTISDGNGASISGNVVTLPNGYKMDVIRKGFEHILLVNGANRTIVRIDSINTTTRELTVNLAPGIGTSASWRIGLPVRQYEVFLPFIDGSLLSEGLAGLNPHLSSPDNFIPTLEFPKCYANIGVHAIEEKGNQQIDGDIGASAKIFRIRREKPAPPVALPPDSDKVFASPANYYGDSYYTYRWSPASFLRTHIYRALDESIFLCDYDLRPKNAGDPNLTISATDDSIFPDINSEPIWDALKRQTITTELNALNDSIRAAANRAEGLAFYREISNDGLRILAGLAHNKKAFQQITIQPFENSDPKIVNGLGPDNPDNFNINPSLKKFIDKLPGKAANRYFYRAAFVDQAENIGDMNLPTVPIYLPDVQPAKKPVITKITAGQKEIKLQWASQKADTNMRLLIYSTNEEDRTRDVRLMGAPIANLPLACLICEAGKIDFGSDTDITQVHKVFDASTFNPANDWLTGQTANEYLAIEAAPVAGILSGITANDGTEIVAVYTDSNGGLQYTACRQLARSWTHAGIIGGKVYFYRMQVQKHVSIGLNSFVVPSLLSSIVSGKPYDLTPPTPPTISTIEWVKVNDDGDVFPFNAAVPASEQRYKAVRLQWTSADPNLKSLIQYQNNSLSGFKNASGWLSNGNYEYVHRNDLEFLDQEYRIKVINESGNINQSFNPSKLIAN